MNDPQAICSTPISVRRSLRVLELDLTKDKDRTTAKGSEETIQVNNKAKSKTKQRQDNP